MFFDDLLPPLVSGFRIVVVEPNIVGAKGAMIVSVRFSIGRRVELTKVLALSTFE